MAAGRPDGAEPGSGLAGEPGGRRVGEPRHPRGDLVGLTAPAERHAGGLVALDVLDGVVGQPGSMQAAPVEAVPVGLR